MSADELRKLTAVPPGVPPEFAAQWNLHVDLLKRTSAGGPAYADATGYYPRVPPRRTQAGLQFRNMTAETVPVGGVLYGYVGHDALDKPLTIAGYKITTFSHVRDRQLIVNSSGKEVGPGRTAACSLATDRPVAALLAYPEQVWSGSNEYGLQIGPVPGTFALALGLPGFYVAGVNRPENEPLTPVVSDFGHPRGAWCIVTSATLADRRTCRPMQRSPASALVYDGSETYLPDISFTLYFRDQGPRVNSGAEYNWRTPNAPVGAVLRYGYGVPGRAEWLAVTDCLDEPVGTRILGIAWPARPGWELDAAAGTVGGVNVYKRTS